MIKAPTLESQLKQLHNCIKKRKYKTRIDADLAIAEVWAAKRRNLVKFGCKWCYAYHLTKGTWRDEWSIQRGLSA